MSIKDIFDTMEYGPAPESAADALAWIVDQGGRFGLFIDGAFTAPGETFDTCNPATGEVLAEITQAGPEDVAAAVAAARAAQPGWQALGGHGRARVLYALARLLQKHARLFAVLETLDNGKPVRESRDIDIPLAQRHFYYHAGQAELMDDTMPGRVPLGVCGQIVPWNFPLLMLAWKIAPALAMGNTVVLKPAEWTSLTALLFADICAQAGVPRGVVNIVTGDGAVGEMIVAADVDKIAFTGSTAVGKRLVQSAGTRLARLTLELGGKSPSIIMPDADLPAAIEGVSRGIFDNGGQVCVASARIYAHRDVYDDVIAGMADFGSRLHLGHGLAEGTDLGPLVSKAQADRVAGYVDEGRAEGARVVSGGIREADTFYTPTVLTDVTPQMRLMREEIFGPVAVVTPFDDLDEVVGWANDSPYGLAASVWTEGLSNGHRIAAQLEAGTVWVNCHSFLGPELPKGGHKESGWGYENGPQGLENYLETKTVVMVL